MAHLVKEATGQHVDVADDDRQLLAYYRGEGFVPAEADDDQQPAAVAAQTGQQPPAEGTDLTV